MLSPNMEFVVTRELHEAMLPVCDETGAVTGEVRCNRVIAMQQIPDDTLGVMKRVGHTGCWDQSSSILC